MSRNKVLSILLALSFVLSFVLAACGGSATSAPAPAPAPAQLPEASVPQTSGMSIAPGYDAILTIEVKSATGGSVGEGWLSPSFLLRDGMTSFDELEIKYELHENGNILVAKTRLADFALGGYFTAADVVIHSVSAKGWTFTRRGDSNVWDVKKK